MQLKTLTLGILLMFSAADVRLKERKLGDVGVISLPRSIKDGTYQGVITDQPNRLVFSFNTAYFWASFGSGQAFKHMLFVSVMAPDAPEADYADYPNLYRLSYDNRKTVRSTSVGTATLQVREGVYRQNTLQEPSHTFMYADKARRLQIVWHAVKKEVSLEEGVVLIGRMAASFAIRKEPVAVYAEMRDRPRKEAEDRERKRTLANEMLKREGLADLQPGKPVLKNGVWVEWMNDPEPRFQLLLPLGRVKARPNVMGAQRPRPATLLNPDNKTRRELIGSVGWWDYWENEWGFHNHDNAYLPFKGTAEKLSEANRDPAWVFFYYSATVRVEEVTWDERLSNLRWFFDTVPEVQQLWREGKLIKGLMDDAPFPIRPNPSDAP